MAKTEAEWAPMKQKATGIIFLRSSMVTEGLARASGANHMKIPYKHPTPSCRLEIVIGNPVFPPAAFKASLLVMLYCRRQKRYYYVSGNSEISELKHVAERKSDRGEWGLTMNIPSFSVVSLNLRSSFQGTRGQSRSRDRCRRATCSQQRQLQLLLGQKEHQRWKHPMRSVNIIVAFGIE